MSADDVAAFVVTEWNVGSRLHASSALAAYFDYAWGRSNMLREGSMRVVRKTVTKTRQQNQSDVPAIDLLPLFQAAHTEIRAAGGVPQLDDLTLRNLAMAMTQVDLALRPSDVACMPACNFRTEPAHLEWQDWHRAEEIYVVLSNPKEQKLRASGGWWSQEVRLQANPHNKRPFYRETLSVTLLQELMSRYAKNGWLASPRLVHGRSVFLESMFMSTAGTGPTANRRLAVHRRDGTHPTPALSPDTVGKQGVFRLMSLANVPEGSFTQGQTRHGVASYVFHLWVADDDVEIEAAWLQEFLRHTDPGTLKRHYVCQELPPAVVKRHKLGYRDVSSGQLQLTELLRI